MSKRSCGSCIYFKKDNSKYKCRGECTEEFRQTHHPALYNNIRSGSSRACQFYREGVIDMKIYIAGAISDNPNYKEQFSTAEKQLISEGFTVINPVKNEGFSYKEYIDMGLCELMRCEAIYMLPGWEKSNGAKLEYNYALTVGLKVYT